MSLQNHFKFTKREQATLDRAFQILEAKTSYAFENNVKVENPDTIVDLLRLQYTGKKQEEFGIIFLNNQHEVLGYKSLFKGGTSSAMVDIKIVASECLRNEASAVILYHNHPSGVCEASQHDIDLTSQVKKALDILDIRLLDHIILCRGTTVSLASQGLIR